MILPESIFNHLKEMNIEQKMEIVNDGCKKYVQQINAAGVPDPLDHILFTLALIIALYFPTKAVHSVLDLIYGRSSTSDSPIQSPQRG